MAHRKIALVLKLAVVLSIAACVVVGVWVIPQVEAGEGLPVGATPAYWAAVIPLVALGAVAISVASGIAKDRIFVSENARKLHWMAALAALDALVWLIILVLYVLTRSSAPKLAVTSSLSVAIIFSVTLTAACGTLSLFAERAAKLQEENDLVV